MITNWFGGYSGAAPTRTYADARPLPKLDVGQYVFATKCSPCHSLANGTRVGPDLAGVTTRRDRAWLAKYIAAPDAMLSAGDPIAKKLFADYHQVQMPNLQLSDGEIQGVLGYLATLPPAAK
jgi:protein SCO1/2